MPRKASSPDWTSYTDSRVHAKVHTLWNLCILCFIHYLVSCNKLLTYKRRKYTIFTARRIYTHAITRIQSLSVCLCSSLETAEIELVFVTVCWFRCLQNKHRKDEWNLVQDDELSRFLHFRYGMSTVASSLHWAFTCSYNTVTHAMTQSVPRFVCNSRDLFIISNCLYTCFCLKRLKLCERNFVSDDDGPEFAYADQRSWA